MTEQILTNSPKSDNLRCPKCGQNCPGQSPLWSNSHHHYYQCPRCQSQFKLPLPCSPPFHSLTPPLPNSQTPPSPPLPCPLPPAPSSPPSHSTARRITTRTWKRLKAKLEKKTKLPHSLTPLLPNSPTPPLPAPLPPCPPASSPDDWDADFLTWSDEELAQLGGDL